MAATGRRTSTATLNPFLSMSANPVEYTVPGLTRQGDNGLAGIVQLGATVPLVLYPEAVFSPPLADFKAKVDAYHAAEDAEKNAHTELRNAAAAGRVFAANLVDVFKPILGRTWDESWKQLGFIQPTLAIPSTYDRLREVLRASTAYLTTHPAAEVASRNVTAVIATGLYTAMADATANVESCASETKAKRQELDTAMTALQDVVRGLITELSLKLSPVDPRWRAFGLNIPGHPAVPDAVENLTVSGHGAGVLWLQWDASARAERYQVEMLVLPDETEFTRVDTVGETNAVLSDLAPGANVKLRVVAVNDGGAGVPSDEVPTTVPVALAA